MRSWATFLDALGGVRPFGHILDTVKTGTPGFDAVFGMGIFDFLAEHPESAATFDAAMSERTAAFAPSVADAYDFSDMRTVVDVGGGQGTLLTEILRKHGHLHGVLLETPAVAARAEALLDATDIADRSEVLRRELLRAGSGTRRLLRASQRPARLGRHTGDARSCATAADRWPGQARC